MQVINKEKESPFLEQFTVMGNNWKKGIGIDPNGMELTQVVMEAGTRGVEKFLSGEYETESVDKPVGFGAVIIVRHDKTKRNWSLPSPEVLANAGAFKDAREVQKNIDKNK